MRGSAEAEAGIARLMRDMGFNLERAADVTAVHLHGDDATL